MHIQLFLLLKIIFLFQYDKPRLQHLSQVFLQNLSIRSLKVSCLQTVLQLEQAVNTSIQPIGAFNVNGDVGITPNKINISSSLP